LQDGFENRTHRYGEIRLDPVPDKYAGIQLKTDEGHLQILYRCPACDSVMDCFGFPFGQNITLSVPLDNKNYLEFVCPTCGGKLQLSSLFVKAGKK
jgi:predicted RNA-binding Zn-ribbon protein involved in translation (DUF1610 family)